MIVLIGFHPGSKLPQISFVALEFHDNAFSLDGGASGSVLCSSMSCVNVMSYDIIVSKHLVLARQGPSESDLFISMGCVNSMLDDIDVS